MPLKYTKPPHTTTSILLRIMIAAVLLFIWGNSLESMPNSQVKSLGIVKLITPLLEPIVGGGNVTDHLVRKLAHFVEFGLLGTLMTSYAIVQNDLQLQSVVNCMSFSLMAAVIDESLQLLSNRGSQVQDVLLDFLGAISGIALVLLIRSILWRLRPPNG